MPTEMTLEAFAGGARPAGAGVQGVEPPATMSFEEFAGAPEGSPTSQVFDRTLLGLKRMGGEAAAISDLVLSMPGLVMGVGAQLGGTVMARAAGVPGGAQPGVLYPFTAFTVGREAGREVAEPLMSPLYKVMQLFKSGEAYENAATTKGMEKLTTLIEDAGVWVERASGGRVSRDAVPMLAETLMAASVGLGPKRAPGIDEAMMKRLRESQGRLREQAEAEATAQTLTPEEFVARVPVQQQINDLLAIRTPAEQARVTRQRRADVKAAFTRGPGEEPLPPEIEARGTRQYGDVGESQFYADERTRMEAEQRAREAGEEPQAVPYEVPEARPEPPERIAHRELLNVLQKPGFERTADDLLLLRRAREGGKASTEELALLSAAGIGATAGAALDEETLRGATLGVATGLGFVLPFIGRGEAIPSKMKQAGAVKAPGGMWHPEAVDRLADQLYASLARTIPMDDPKAIAAKAQSRRMVKGYLDKYAGTERDPLKDIELPSGRRWEQAADDLIRSRPASDYQPAARVFQRMAEEVQPGILRAPPEEPIYNLQGIGGSAWLSSTREIRSYLSHVGDYLRDNVDPAKLQQYDLVRAVRETAVNDKRVAKEMEKATAASTAQLPVYKAYDDGFKWVELKLPEKLTEEQGKGIKSAGKLRAEALDAERADIPDAVFRERMQIAAREPGYMAVDTVGNPIKNAYTDELARGATPEEAWLAGRMAEEGNIMGHCVGGYCPTIISGESKIFSLRDAKGQSHVTIEVTPTEKLLAPDIAEGMKARGEELPLNIEQIKGKQNRAPEPKYLPYVQDFVKGGKWGEVGDLQNTGLVQTKTSSDLTGLEPGFYTKEEISAAAQARRGPSAQQGFIDQKLVVGLGAIGLGGVLGGALSDDPASGALLGALAGGALMLPGVRRRLKQAAEAADYGIGNISTRIRNTSPALALAARRFEMRNLMESHAVLHQVAPFMAALEKVPKEKRAALDRALLTNDAEAIAAGMKGNPELVAGWRQVRNTLNELGTRLAGYGRFRMMKDDYFPRLVKDVEGLKAALGTPERTRLETALREAEQAAMRSRGTPLTSIEQSAIINREVQAVRRARGYLPGFAKARAVEEVTEQLRPFYHTPSESLYAYVRGAVQDLETAKFFGKDLQQRTTGGQSYIDLDASIGNVVGRELAAGKITHPQAQQMISMLQSRFRAGERSSNAIIQDLRNLGNMGLLGNIVSGATQAADAMLAVYAQDLRSTTATIARQLSGRERIAARDFGLADHIAEEFVSGSRTANWLNKMFKYSGFAGIDRFGKTTQIGAALSKYERWSQTPSGVARIREKYGEAYAEEFPQLIDDLKAGRLNERTRLLAFSELSDMQPISKMEMPQAYLDHPNGRIMYMLKTFMIKQMDVIRRDTYNEIKKGNVVRGLKNLTEYGLVLGLSGATTQMVKDWLMGKEVGFETTDVLEQMLRTFGWGAYVRDRAAQGRPVEALVGTIAPPYRMMDDIIRRDPKAVQYIPIIGKLYYSWELGGKEEAELRAAREAKKEGRPVTLSPEAIEYRRQRREERRQRLKAERQ